MSKNRNKRLLTRAPISRHGQASIFPLFFFLEIMHTSRQVSRRYLRYARSRGR